MTHKELTAHIRRRINVAGIKARVKMNSSCGNKVIQVITPAFDVSFTDKEQREIRLIAKVNHLTWVRGMEIDIDRMTDPMQMDFYLQN